VLGLFPEQVPAIYLAAVALILSGGFGTGRAARP
jgi:hypothetical protein